MCLLQQTLWVVDKIEKDLCSMSPTPSPTAKLDMLGGGESTMCSRHKAGHRVQTSTKIFSHFSHGLPTPQPFPSQPGCWIFHSGLERLVFPWVWRHSCPIYPAVANFINRWPAYGAAGDPGMTVSSSRMSGPLHPLKEWYPILHWEQSRCSTSVLWRKIELPSSEWERNQGRRFCLRGVAWLFWESWREFSGL